MWMKAPGKFRRIGAPLGWITLGRPTLPNPCSPILVESVGSSAKMCRGVAAGAAKMDSAAGKDRNGPSVGAIPPWDTKTITCASNGDRLHTNVMLYIQGFSKRIVQG